MELNVLFSIFLMFFCFSFKCTSSNNLDLTQIKCLGVTLKEAFPYPNLAEFGGNYSIVLRHTDWMSNKTAKYREYNFNKSISVEKWDREGHFSWFNERLFYFETLDHQNDSCHAFNSTTNFEMMNAYNLSKNLLDIYKINGYSFSSFLISIIGYNMYNSSSFLQDIEHRVGGVESAQWLACLNNFTYLLNEKLNLQVIVDFAGDKTKQQPYDPHFTNPLVYGVSVIVYKGNSPNFTILSNSYFEIVELEQTNSNLDEFKTGFYCEGLPKVKLPLLFPQSFELTSEFKVIGGEKGQPLTIDDVKVAFSSDSKLVLFELDFSKPGNRDNPFYGSESGFFGKRRIIHDFNYGLEYVINYDDDLNPQCQKVQPIHANFGDVFLGENNTLFMNQPSTIFLAHLHPENFYYAGKVVLEGISLDLYVGKATKNAIGYEIHDAVIWRNDTVVELLYWPSLNEVITEDQPEEFLLHSIAYNYKSIDGTLTKQASFRFFNFKLSNESFNSKVFDISTCFYPEDIRRNLKRNKGLNVGQQSDVSLKFYILFSGASLSEIRAFGFNDAVNFLRRALSNSSYISLLRVEDIQLKEYNKQLFAYFTFLRSSDVDKQAPVFDLKPEISVDNAKNILNATITSAKGFSITLTGEEGVKSLILKASAPLEQVSSGVAPWPPTPSPKPQGSGYTLSSMLILAFFSFLFGVLFVVGSMVFYQKRLQLRQMAYQVFE